MSPTTGRAATWTVMFLFFALGALVSTMRFAGSASAQPAANEAPEGQKAAAANADDSQLAGRFSGRVTGPDGKPVAGARVFVAAQYDGLPLTARAKTDAEGRYSFDAPDMMYIELDGLPARRSCIVSATADGYGPDWVGTWERRRSTTGDLALQLIKDDVPIRGRLLSPDGRPLAGARVRLNGLQVPLGRDLDAHLKREKNIDEGASPGYENWIGLPNLSSLIPAPAETRTDADGRFTLSGLGRDRLAQLAISAPSVVDTHVTVMTRAAPDAPIHVNENLPNVPAQVIHGANFTLALKPGRTISGVVRNRDSRQPIAGMLVGIGRDNPFSDRTKDEAFPRDGVLWSQTVTDALGQFSITGLDPAVVKHTVTAASAPGMKYMSASVFVEGEARTSIECERGIPFRLKLVDEGGRPVEAEVNYWEVTPNPHAPRPFCYPTSRPLSQAARKGDGTYHGFVVPGPGALLVTTPGRSDFRAAYVDPKAFFAPGRTKWTPQEWISSYGSKDTLMICGGQALQDEYAAIVLVNPPLDSGPLELSATLVKDRPRRVSLVDPDGKPVVGVQPHGITLHPYDSEPGLRAASFPLTKLHPDRVRRITFIKEDRQLIASLLARGDAEAPYTVRMQPWSGVTARIVDDNGYPIVAASVHLYGKTPEANADSEDGWPAGGGETDASGRFRVDKLIPGQAYRADVYRDRVSGKMIGTAFENLVLRAGEVRDLGDIRAKAVEKR
jgi:hypothetical protein